MQLLRGDDAAFVVVFDGPGAIVPVQWAVFAEVRDMGGAQAIEPRCNWISVDGPDAVQLVWTREQTQAMRAGQYKLALRFERLDDGLVKTSGALTVTVRERL